MKKIVVAMLIALTATGAVAKTKVRNEQIVCLASALTLGIFAMPLGIACVE